MYQGQAIYRDFFDFLTPGAFYLYALAYAVGGVSITSARATTALLHAISVVCTYFLTLHVASMGEAILAGLLVVVVCVPVWNMASHHWIATAFGLATAAVLLAPRWRGSERARPAAAGALAGLVVCTHQARGVWLIVWLAVTIPLLTIAPRDADRWRRCLRELVWTALGGAAVCVPILGYAVWRSSFAEMLYATHTWVTTNYRKYNVGIIRWAGYGSFWCWRPQVHLSLAAGDRSEDPRGRGDQRAVGALAVRPRLGGRQAVVAPPRAQRGGRHRVLSRHRPRRVRGAVRDDRALGDDLPRPDGAAARRWPRDAHRRASRVRGAAGDRGRQGLGELRARVGR